MPSIDPGQRRSGVALDQRHEPLSSISAIAACPASRRSSWSRGRLSRWSFSIVPKARATRIGGTGRPQDAHRTPTGDGRLRVSTQRANRTILGYHGPGSNPREVTREDAILRNRCAARSARSASI